ncbi:magnesium-transporting ATPase (P-type) [Bradyrhizobium barranii subsp. barranii]
MVGLAVLSSLPLPLLPLQILYLNLVTDVFPAFALAFGEGEAGILRHPPRDPREPILGRRRWIVIILHGGALTAGAFGALATSSWLGLEARATVTVTFLTLAFAQLWHTFNMRDPQSPLIVNEITRNGWLWSALLLCVALLAVPPYFPPAALLLQLSPPTADMWSVVLLFSLAPMIVTQTISVVVRGSPKIAATTMRRHL